MKSKWDIYKVEDICAEEDGSISIGPFGSRLKSNEYTETGIPVIRGKNISDSPGFDGDFAYISEEKADSLGTSNVYKNELVFPHRGAIGEVGIINDQNRYVLSSSLMKLKCNQEFVNPRYVYYFFKSRLGRHELLKNSSQVGTPGIGQPLTSLKNIDIPIPPKSFQDKIDNYLTTLDQKIHLNQQTNETLEAMAQAIFKSWFVDFDPVRAKIEARSTGRDPNRAVMAAITGVSMEQDWVDIDSTLQQKLDRMTETQRERLRQTAELFPDELVEDEIGEVPKGWEMVNINELADIIYGAPFSSKKFNSEKKGYPLIRIRDLKTFEPDNWTEEVHKKGSKVYPGDLLVGMDGEFRATYWFGIESWLNQRVLKVSPKRNIPLGFLKMSIEPHLKFFERSKVGTTVIHLGKRDVDGIEILKPKQELLNKIGNILNPVLRRMVSNMEESRNLANLRNTLLPKLISGEVGV